MDLCGLPIAPPRMDSSKGRYSTEPELQRFLLSSLRLQRELVIFSKARSIFESLFHAALRAQKERIRATFELMRCNRADGRTAGRTAMFNWKTCNSLATAIVCTINDGQKPIPKLVVNLRSAISTWNNESLRKTSKPW